MLALLFLIAYRIILPHASFIVLIYIYIYMAYIFNFFDNIILKILIMYDFSFANELLLKLRKESYYIAVKPIH